MPEPAAPRPGTTKHPAAPVRQRSAPRPPSARPGGASAPARAHPDRQNPRPADCRCGKNPDHAATPVHAPSPPAPLAPARDQAHSRGQNHAVTAARPGPCRWLQRPATGPGGRPHLPRIDAAAFDDRCDGGLQRRRAGRGELAEGPAARGRQILLARERARRAHMHVESIPDETELPERTAGDRDELFVNGLLAAGDPAGAVVVPVGGDG